MKRSMKLAWFLALGLTGCATPVAQGPIQPSAAERAAAEAAGYELAPVRAASALLPPEFVAGPHHSVGELVNVVGTSNRYRVTSEFGSYDVRGDDLLRIRVREIEALAALHEMSKTAEFARAAGEAMKTPFVATWNLITDPVDSILGVPRKAWEGIKSTAQLARGERGNLEGSGFAEFIGFEGKKRSIAAELGVDPYSSNARLQKQLNRFAWAAYAGGLPFMFVPFTNDDGEGETGDRVTRILLHYSPEDLRRLNRIELSVMGVPEPLRDEFITHPWYSPRHHTVLVDSLATLGLTADRTAFIEAAVSARSEDDAYSYQRTAELLRTYDERVSLFRQLVAVDGRVAGYTEDGALVLPLAADYTLWTPDIEVLADSLKGAGPPGLEVERRIVVVSGSLSPLAREHFGALGIEVTERAFESLAEPAPVTVQSDLD
jgi:hypothetical protein